MTREKRYECQECGFQSYARWNFCLTCGVRNSMDLITNPNENLAKHRANPFYEDVLSFWLGIRDGQIKKGAEKYPEPFNPDSWSVEELAVHAMQENVDQAVYITGMRDRLRKQQQHIRNLEDRVKELEDAERSDS